MNPGPDRSRRTASGVAVVALLVLAACRATGGGSPGDSAQPSSPATSVSALPSATASEDLGSFNCALPVHAAATIDRALITDVRVAGHDGYDRIVIEFAAGLPEYTIATATPPLTQDASGLPMDVAGSVFSSLVMHGASRISADGLVTSNYPSDFKPGLTQIAELAEAGDFEAVSSWYIGLNDVPCLRILTLTEPSRLVIDIEH